MNIDFAARYRERAGAKADEGVAERLSVFDALVSSLKETIARNCPNNEQREKAVMTLDAAHGLACEAIVAELGQSLFPDDQALRESDLLEHDDPVGSLRNQRGEPVEGDAEVPDAAPAD